MSVFVKRKVKKCHGLCQTNQSRRDQQHKQRSCTAVCSLWLLTGIKPSYINLCFLAVCCKHQPSTQTHQQHLQTVLRYLRQIPQTHDGLVVTDEPLRRACSHQCAPQGGWSRPWPECSPVSSVRPNPTLNCLHSYMQDGAFNDTNSKKL